MLAKKADRFKHALMLGDSAIHDENDVLDIELVPEPLDPLTDLVGRTNDLEAAFDHLLEGFWHRPLLPFHAQGFEKAKFAEPVRPEGRSLSRRCHGLLMGAADGNIAAQDHAATRRVFAEPEPPAMPGRFIDIGLEHPAHDVEIGGERDHRAADLRRPAQRLRALGQRREQWRMRQLPWLRHGGNLLE